MVATASAVTDLQYLDNNADLFSDLTLWTTARPKPTEDHARPVLHLDRRGGGWQLAAGVCHAVLAQTRPATNVRSPISQASVPATDTLIAQAGPAGGPQSSANPQLHLKGPGPHKGDWLRKYLGLPPSQQEQTLEEDPSFQSLPPEKQKHLLDRLRMFNSLAPEKKQKILNRMEFYEHLPPEKQAEAHTLFEQYQRLPAGPEKSGIAGLSQDAGHAAGPAHAVHGLGRVPQQLQ